MRRALAWGAAAAVAALVVWIVASESFFRPLLAIAPVVLFAVVLLVRVLMAPAGARRKVVAPGLLGLDEVQGLYLGRPQPAPVTYGSEVETVAELVVDGRPDPLDRLDLRDLAGSGPAQPLVAQAAGESERAEAGSQPPA